MHVPEVHRRWLDAALPVFEGDERFLGVGACGSWLRDEMDAWSDLDLVLLVASSRLEEVRRDRLAIAAACGPVVNVFSAEHVGEPDMLIALYGPPLLHVDMKFTTPERFGAQRVEDPAILWERDGALTQTLAQGTAAWPTPDPQWIEDRVWTWLHYLATKIGRGEWMEVVSSLEFLRAEVLGPLTSLLARAKPQGVRRLEVRDEARALAMRDTLGGFDRATSVAAAYAFVDQYRDLRAALGPQAPQPKARAEAAALAFLDEVASGA